MLEIFETGVRYQVYHALALIALAALPETLISVKSTSKVALLFGIGILIFSGSLYLLVLTNTLWLGAITPIGGVCFVLGWFLLFLASLRKNLA